MAAASGWNPCPEKAANSSSRSAPISELYSCRLSDGPLVLSFRYSVSALEGLFAASLPGGGPIFSVIESPEFPLGSTPPLPHPVSRTMARISDPVACQILLLFIAKLLYRPQKNHARGGGPPGPLFVRTMSAIQSDYRNL